MNNKETFEYAYVSEQQAEIEKIRKKYLPKEEDKMERLRKLDRKAETPGLVVSLVLGIAGCLVFGTGMSCIMVWSDTLFFAGIVLGILGMILIALAYPVYTGITRKQKQKIAPEILELTEELLR